MAGAERESFSVKLFLGIEDLVAQYINHSLMLRLILVDEEERIFIIQRYCFLDSIDDWIEIGRPDTLKKHLRIYVKHLGREPHLRMGENCSGGPCARRDRATN
ncbi:MAG: hypothetical protein ACE5OR_09685 [bacterium]